jgi:hypothetical protein
MYPLATKAGVLLAAALALWGVLGYFGSEGAYQKLHRDPYRIAAEATRLETFREAVASNAILGYLTDVPLGNEASDGMFLAAQYTLAPRILQRETKHPHVLGNFTRPVDFAAAGRPYGLTLERDFGNGVVLYRSETH